MKMVLTPILKAPMSSSVKDLNASRVTFNLPIDQESIVEYLRREDELSETSKLQCLVKAIYSKDTEVYVLQKWICEFSDNILFFNKQNEFVIFALLRVEWWTKDESFICAYQEFILNLVTAHASFLSFVFQSFINAFMKVPEDKEIATYGDCKGLQYVHSVAKRIIELIPLSEANFYAMLVKKFPYMKMPTAVILRYVENLLSVCSYLPGKRYLIMECIIEKLIQIDVLCSKDVIEDFEFQLEEIEKMELDSQSTADEIDDKMAFPLAHTLDALLNCLFTYIKGVCFPFGEQKLHWESTRKIYKELLTVFDKIILPTRGSCHVQYLLFYICSLKQELSVGFLDFLWKKVQNPSVPPILRQISSFYIGSFLSRAKYINISTVTGCLDLLCSWIHRYIDNHTSQDLGVHGTFHSVCQTVFYVFAFRNKELIEMKNGYKYLKLLNFDRIVTCRLNPLRFCDTNIAQNFASLTRNHQIAYVYPVIERNNRNLLYSMCQSRSIDPPAGAMIPTFFPFDPYFLKRSKHWIEVEFRPYNHSANDDQNANHSDDEEMCTNDELFSYSMSPGFKKNISLKHIHC